MAEETRTHGQGLSPESYYDSARKNRHRTGNAIHGKTLSKEIPEDRPFSAVNTGKRNDHTATGCKGRIPILPRETEEIHEDEIRTEKGNPFATLQHDQKSTRAKRELRAGISPPPVCELPVKKAEQRASQPYDFILVLDFEATCENNDYRFPHEIIEFPVVVIDTAKRRVVSEFRSYVKPKRFGGKLTSFCTELTGITQSQVDAAPLLEEVIHQFMAWYEGNVPKSAKTIFATDGPWDLRNFMCQHSAIRDQVKFPKMFYSYLDVRHCFADHMHCKPRGIQAMLAKLSLVFEGRQHCGLDDTKNIARIVLALMKRGYIWSNVVKVNEERLRRDFENEQIAEALSAMTGRGKQNQTDHPTKHNDASKGPGNKKRRPERERGERKS